MTVLVAGPRRVPQRDGLPDRHPSKKRRLRRMRLLLFLLAIRGGVYTLLSLTMAVW